MSAVLSIAAVFVVAGSGALAAGSGAAVITSSPSTKAAGVSTGEGHTCALTRAGGIKCWGANQEGELGNPTLTDSAIPRMVSGLATGAAAVSAGGFSTCALTNSGAVKCWGSDAAVEVNNRPTAVYGLTGGVVAISAGGGHTCALTSSGGVKCWGFNTSGQLGDGTTTDGSVIPLDVAGLTSGVVAIDLGGSHSCALTSSGGVKCWGANHYGQLGDGSTTDRNEPTAVYGLTSGVVAISAGGDHTCALTSSGGVKCWGRNRDGQLGDGTTTERHLPVDVSGLASGVAMIAAGGANTCALTTEGKVKCWGSNSWGELGDGTRVHQRDAPVDVLGLERGVTTLSAGGSHVCVLASRGRVECWGANVAGQLGDGTTTTRPKPVGVVGFGPDCLVPNVAGKLLVKARTALQQRNCRVGKVTTKLTVAKNANRVLKQRPRAGKRLGNGSAVNLVIGRKR